MRQFFVAFFLTALAWAGGDGPAELPRLTVDTSMPDTAGYTVVNVTAGGTAAQNMTNLQNAVNAAACKTIINVPANANYQGPASLVPPATVCTASTWIIVQSADMSFLPVGVRVNPSQKAHMPQIPISTNDTSPIASTAGRYAYWRFQGLEIYNDAVFPFFGSLINLGNNETLVSNEPDHIIFDRSYIHGTTVAQNKDTVRGIAFGGPYQAAINSYFEQFVSGSDTQCAYASNSPGPLDFENNYCEASAEGIMFGGSDPFVPGLLEQDITIKGNHFYKPLSWKSNEPQYDTFGAAWSIKNGLECKAAQRVLVENNIIDNAWAGGQTGQGIYGASRSQGGNDPQANCGDWTVRYNLIRHVGEGIAFLAGDGPGSQGNSAGWSGGTFRFSAHDNVVLDVNYGSTGAGLWNGNGYGMRTGGPDNPWLNYIAQSAADMSFSHNTILPSTGFELYFSLGATGSYSAGTLHSTPRLSVLNNLTDFGVHALGVSSTASGTPSLNQMSGTTWTYAGNVLNNYLASAGWTPADFPAGNQACGSGSCFPNPGASTYSVIKFASELGCERAPFDPLNCALQASSPYHLGGTDSLDIGADAAGLATRVASVIHLWKVFSVTPSTVTHGNSTVLTLIVKNINTVNGALPTVQIGGQTCTSPTTTYDGQRMTCVMPVGLGVGTYSIVVTDNGETATLTNGITFN